MQVTINGQHVEVTNTLRKYVGQKLARIGRHVGPVIRGHAVLPVTRNYHRVETTVHTKGTQWHTTTEDMRAAIDRVVDKLNLQAIKHKRKVVDHHQEEGGLKNRPYT
jgi:putative sigma-54 modulation protein